jgi:ribose-phosphate pyrophosphokinase
MIKINGYVVKPTIFPDQTSQVWNLPEWLFKDQPGSDSVVWYFEKEREIIDLLSLRKLFPKSFILHIPYLPYARQDKGIHNTSTFNLRVFADLINSLHCHRVTSVDVHNPELTKELICNFVNIEATYPQRRAAEEFKPDYYVFPDKGASKRYPSLSCHDQVTFEKKRDQITGAILSHEIDEHRTSSVFTNTHHGTAGKDNKRFLIVDDLCDRGSTFISIAKKLRETCKDPAVGLFVTHGLFSGGRGLLTDVGIKLYTTNSLLRNKDDFEV